MLDNLKPLYKSCYNPVWIIQKILLESLLSGHGSLGLYLFFSFGNMLLCKHYLHAQEELAKLLGSPDHGTEAYATQKFKEAMDFMEKTVKSAVEHYRKTTCQGNLVVDEILEYTSDEKVVLADCMTYLIGSFHNTGNMLASGLFFLAKHQDIQEKLYNEIIQVLGEDGLVDESNFKHLRYLRQVIDESIRCGAFGTFAARYQEADTTLGGYKIPKNTPVIQALGTVMRDEKIWPKPTKFDPDRFNEDNSKNRSPFAFKPFGFSGKRICPGFKFVHPKSAVFLTTLLRRFKIMLHGEQQIEFEHGLATHSTEEMWAKILKR
ncbi:cytochrome P450 20A1 [Elysia marginata]|uniref:Cytochrome P450 20A1 n=1 Tax=Elysia marginata TaxID=1093978 RepID=A0AAV4IP93_9GAST|nr:cytochrome P450 20A1 [Elysia marginata]